MTKTSHPTSVGCDKDGISNNCKTRKLEAALPDCRLVDISVATSSQRMVKSKEEIEVSIINDQMRTKTNAM